MKPEKLRTNTVLKEEDTCCVKHEQTWQSTRWTKQRAWGWYANCQACEQG